MFACKENATAMKHFQKGIAALKERQVNRQLRDVEGKSEA